MDSRAYVALAKAADINRAARARRLFGCDERCRLIICGDGSEHTLHHDSGSWVEGFGGIAMSASFSPENFATRAALVRALLASAVRTYPPVGHDAPIASPVIQPRAAAQLAEIVRYAPSKAEARDALLDALLAETLTARDCVCGGTGHTERGEPCDGPGGAGCLTDARNLADFKATVP